MMDIGEIIDATDTLGVKDPASPPPPLEYHKPNGRKGSEYSSIVYDMVESGHNKWGFLIYRVSYDDDEAWKRFLGVIAQSADEGLRFSGEKERLGPYLHYTVIEDRAAYDGAPKHKIRGEFRTWIHARSAERDGPGVDRIDPERNPRYRFCIYADKASMNAAKFDPGISNPSFPDAFNFSKIRGYAILVDAQLDDYPDDLGEPDESELADIAAGGYTYEEWLEVRRGEQYEPIEGHTTKDVGWLYVALSSFPEIYGSLLIDDDSEWDRYYQRPPTVYPYGEHYLEV